MNNDIRTLIDNMSFEKAHNSLKDIIIDTNLIYSNHFSEVSNNEVYLKPENLQMTGAFKIRGAFNKVSKLTEEEKNRGIITASAGNHAQGVAYAANKLGVKCTILMPETTPLIKVQSTKSYGEGNNMEVILHGNCYDDAYEEAVRLMDKHGYTFIHPFNDIDVIEGQGTISLEILKQLPDADAILVPIGGGGLASGVAICAKQINPDIRIIGVEPEEASCMLRSIEEDRVVSLDTVFTIADGTAVKTPGDLTFEIAKDYIDDIITVKDIEVMGVFIDLIQKHKIISENSGSLSVAALNKLKNLGIQNMKVVPIISGGNIDIVAINDLIDKGLRATGRIYSFNVEVIHKPGELEKVSALIASTGANIISIRHRKNSVKNIFRNINLEVTVETNGWEQVKIINNEFRSIGYTVKPLRLSV